MSTDVRLTNKVFLSGTVYTDPEFSHELYGESFYEFTLEVPRLSEQRDYIPVTVSERLMSLDKLKKGTRVTFYGQFRSFNRIVGDRSKLMLNVFVKDFVNEEVPEDVNPNVAELVGFVCKPPVYRTTPFNREICDLLLAVNRAYDKSDYIPCIAWGRNARFVKTLEVGQHISVVGRIQSREYHKKLDDETTEVRVAYELSINKIYLEEKQNSSRYDSTNSFARRDEREEREGSDRPEQTDSNDSDGI